MLQRLSIAILATLLVAGCAREDAAKLAFNVSTLEETSGPCGEGGDNACGRVALEYPVFSEDFADGAAARLNEAIRGMILSPVFNDEPLPDPNGLIDQFLDEWEKTRREFPGAASTETWTLERRVEVRYREAGAITLLSTETSFTGGAHGMFVQSYSSYEPGTGDRLRLTGVIKERKWDEFLALAETRFREKRGIAPDTDLVESGFEFGGRSIAPDDNWGIVEDGMILRFNPYEIAPYASGPTEYTLTREDLKGMVR